jgi:pimeloyl-ACP methyl ester carboxylesterase
VGFLSSCSTLNPDTKPQSSTYDYPLKERWDALRSPGGDFGDYWVTEVGDTEKGFNLDNFINSPLGKGIIENLVTVLDYTDDMDPALVAEWRVLGVKKEVYSYGDPDNNWAVYTPLAALEPGNTKKYPLVFCLHGYENSILLAETYGYAKLGAREGFITVIPYSNNHQTIVEDTANMMEILRAGYPVDESRIYAAGYSLGGVASLNLVLAYPDLFAAIAPGGCSLDGFGGMISLSNPGWEALTEHGIPLITLFGTLDAIGGMGYPISATPPPPPPNAPPDAPSLSSPDPSLAVYNKWLEINKVTVTLTPEQIDQALASKNRVEQETGIIFQKVYTEAYDTGYHFGEFSNPQGQPVVKIVAVEDLPHWPSGDFAAVAWDFLKHWSRNVTTKELVYTD